MINAVASIRLLFVLGFLFLSCTVTLAQGGDSRDTAPNKNGVSVRDSADPAGDDTSTEKKAASDALDISDLEKRYWAPKDTDFSVVQNRTFTKDGRLSASLAYGPVINDFYSVGGNVNLSANYFLSERMGVELNYMNAMYSDNKTVELFASEFGIKPDYNQVQYFYGASFNWVPIYAKISLLGKRILYFDMAFSPGIGLAEYKQILDSGSPRKQALALTFDVTQYFFISKNLALRLDLRMKWFNEEIREYTRTSSRATDNPNENDVLRTELNQTNVVTFGLTYYF